MQNSGGLIVLLPGMIGTADLFEPLLGVIPPHMRLRVISYPTDRFLSYAKLLVLIEGQLAEEENIILVGESYSGALALAFAAAHPNQVRAVILSAAFAIPPWPTWIRLLIRPWMLRIPMPGLFIRYMVAGRNASDDLVAAIRAAFLRPDPRVLVCRARDVLTMDYSDALARCRAPMLYLSPDRDHMVRPRCLKAMLSVRPDMQVSRMTGPHLILQTAPLEAWRAIEQFAKL